MDENRLFIDELFLLKLVLPLEAAAGPMHPSRFRESV